jgi:hypothetical protein
MEGKTEGKTIENIENIVGAWADLDHYASRGYEDRVVCTGGSPDADLSECLQVGGGVKALSK